MEMSGVNRTAFTTPAAAEAAASLTVYPYGGMQHLGIDLDG
jgi:hypothetical protein